MNNTLIKALQKTFLLTILLCFISIIPVESGWYFNAQLRLTNCSSPYLIVPTIPILPSVGPFPTKSYCESSRSQVIAISVSQTYCSAYDDYGWCTDWQTCVVDFSVSGCTGSDDTTATSPGQINFDNYGQGKPFFSSNRTTELGDWVKENNERNLAYVQLGNKFESGRTGTTYTDNLPRLSGTIPRNLKNDEEFYAEYDLEASDYFYALQTRQTGPTGAIITAEDRERLKIKEPPVPLPVMTEASQGEAEVDGGKVAEVASNVGGWFKDQATEIGAEGLTETTGLPFDKFQKALSVGNLINEQVTKPVMGLLEDVKDNIADSSQWGRLADRAWSILERADKEFQDEARTTVASEYIGAAPYGTGSIFNRFISAGKTATDQYGN